MIVRLEYALSLDEEDDAEKVFGEARLVLEGVGVGGIMGLVDAQGEVRALGSRGERERRKGDEDRGEDTAGV